MRILDTSRRFGGVDIKLKEHRKGKWLVVLLLAGLAFSYLLYSFVDKAFNGQFLDWFSREYMQTYESRYGSSGQTMWITEPNWLKIKALLLVVLILMVSICLITAFFSAHFYARIKKKQTITHTSEMIQDYMAKEQKASDIFPKDYAEVSAQMSEIKNTMQKQEQTLKNEAQRKNDLIAYLAHDLKTPLTSVIGYLSLLDEVPDMPSEQKARYVHIALDKACRLERLINEFFEITRYNLQQIELEKETIDLYYMLVQMSDEFYPLLNAHGNTIELEVPEDMTIYGDAMKLARVFNNILKNAIAYSYPNTEINVQAKETEENTVICFQNKGKTIPPQKLNAIFEKFFRLDEARRTEKGGAGLGLAIAKQIIHLHGGEIRAESEEEVTRFVLLLPVKN